MRYTWKIAGLLLTVAAACWWNGATVQAQQGCTTCAASGSCGDCCLPQPNRTHCPHPFCHTQEGPPCIIYKCGCPRPVCNPCDLPHFGYYQPCWRPSPDGPDWSHCQHVPPAALVHPGPIPQSTMTYPSNGGEPDLLPSGPSHVPPGAEKLPPPVPSKLNLLPSNNY